MMPVVPEKIDDAAESPGVELHPDEVAVGVVCLVVGAVLNNDVVATVGVTAIVTGAGTLGIGRAASPGDVVAKLPALDQVDAQAGKVARPR